MKKRCMVIFLLSASLVCYPRDNNNDTIRNVPIVSIVDTSFYSAIDTLLQAEKENGIVRDFCCAIFVNIHKEGIVRITSVKNKRGSLPCIPQNFKERTLVTAHEGRYVYIIVTGGINISEWVKKTESVSVVSICDAQEWDNTSDNEDLDYPCVLVYAFHDKMHISVVGKEIVPYSMLLE